MIDQKYLTFILISSQVTQNEEEEPDEDEVYVPPPKMTIDVKSSDVLQATITKTCLDVISKLGKVNVTFVGLFWWSIERGYLYRLV